MENSINRKLFLILGNIINAITLLGLLWCNLVSRDIWADEACTIAIDRNSISNITYLTAIDVHPPLYYFIVKLFYVLFPWANENIVGRLVSLLPFVLLWVVSVFVLIRKLGCISIIFPSMLCQFLPLVSHFCEIRMYTWAMFFVVLTAIIGLCLEENSHLVLWGGIILTSLCAAYTHYFALVTVFFVWCIIGMGHIRSKHFLFRWFGAGALVAAGYLPWLYALLGQMENVYQDYWIAPISYSTVRGFFRYIFSIDVWWIKYFVCGGLVILGAYVLVSFKTGNRKRWFMGTYLLMPVSLILFGVVISYIFRPVFVNRYVLVALGVMALGEILILTDMHKKLRDWPHLLFGLAVMGLVIVFGGMNLHRVYQNENMYSKNWEQMIAAIDSKLDNNAVTFLYIRNGQPLVRPLTVMYSEYDHLAENANMSEFNQRLFSTVDYVGQDISGPVFIVTGSSEEINEAEYLGLFQTGNGKYNLFYDSHGYKEVENE